MGNFKNYTIVVLSLALIILAYVHFNKENVKDVIVITKEKTGEVSKEIIKVIPDTVYIEIPSKEKIKEVKRIIVDSTYKSEYNKAIKNNDSLKAKNLFLESIALDTFKGVLLDDENITINGVFKTRGKLLEYNLDYVIKSDTLSVKPTIEYKHPKASFIYGFKLGFPYVNNSKTEPTMEGLIGFQNKKGIIMTLGVDTQKRFTIGYYKTITLFK